MVDLRNNVEHQGVVTTSDNGKWTAIRAALSDEKWDFRTIEGLAKATGLAPEEVSALLKAHSDEVRVSSVPDKRGRVLYTLSNKSVGIQEILASARAFISKST